MSKDGLPIRAKAYIGLLSATAIALLVYLGLRYPVPVAVTAGFGLLVWIAEEFPVPLVHGATYSVSFVITMAAIVALGPAPAALGATFGGLSILFARGERRLKIAKQVFNSAQYAITTGAAALVYVWTGGPVGRVSGIFPRVLIPALLATVTNFLVNTSLVSTMVALAQGERARGVWRRHFASMSLGHVAFAVLGVLLAVLYLQMGWAAILFLFVPLLVARNAFQASVKMAASYEATVRSLITAIEMKDAYTRGHAERVATLAEMAAREYGLSGERLRVIRFAALMHDVGKLGVSTLVLQKPGRLTPEEYEHMKIHPIRGFEIVSEIEFLTEAIGAVRHHHEKMDGTGYPDGLVGEQIPLLARLIMVADAFDSMTSTRVYRTAKNFDEAFAELHRCEGTQFDPVSLRALERAIDKHGWKARPEEAEEVGDGHHIAAL